VAGAAGAAGAAEDEALDEEGGAHRQRSSTEEDAWRGDGANRTHVHRREK